MPGSGARASAAFVAAASIGSAVIVIVIGVASGGVGALGWSLVAAFWALAIWVLAANRVRARSATCGLCGRPRDGETYHLRTTGRRICRPCWVLVRARLTHDLDRLVMEPESLELHPFAPPSELEARVEEEP